MNIIDFAIYIALGTVIYKFVNAVITFVFKALTRAIGYLANWLARIFVNIKKRIHA